MPWYRFHAHHGAGHQCTTEWYRWYSGHLPNAELKFIIENYCRVNYLDNYIAVMRLVYKLPIAEKIRQQDEAQASVYSASQFLKAVKATKTLKRKPNAIRH